MKTKKSTIIALIDTEPMIVESLAEILEDQGYGVMMNFDLPPEEWDGIDNVDLAIVEPFRWGSQFLPFLTQKGIPFIFLTSQIECIEPRVLKDFGALDGILKPSQTEHVLEIVKRVLNRL